MTDRESAPLLFRHGRQSPAGTVPLKVAIIHDWLDTWGGSEHVLVELLALFPDADLFAVVDFLRAEDRARIARQHITTTFLQRMPFTRSHFRKYLALMPFAVEQLDVSGYDLAISSCHAVSKSVLTGPDQLHVCLCYSPPRYAWDLQAQYLAQSGLDRGVAGAFARWSLARLRAADLRASARVDRFVAISHYVARRIQKCYRRDADVIYPPVAFDRQSLRSSIPPSNRYVTVSRLVPYKRVDLLIDTFLEMPDRMLDVIGDGPELARLRANLPSNVVLHGNLPDADRDRIIDGAAAFVFAAEEDFGIAPLEAQARGVPVIAYGRGGTAETIAGLDSKNPTGVLFDRQHGSSIASAIRLFESRRGDILPGACRANADRFIPDRFRDQFRALVDDAWRDLENSRSRGIAS
jgi:glycosyltransferase involved in cell wall biosynthesis